MWQFLFVFICVCLCARAQTLTLDGTPTNCSALVDAPPDYAALATACFADPVCATQYTPSTFVGQLTVFAPFDMPFTQQSALRDLVCGRTLEEIQKRLWVTALKLGAALGSPCGRNQRFINNRCLTDVDTPIVDGDNPQNVGIMASILALLAIVMFVLAAMWVYSQWQARKKSKGR